MLFHLLVTVIVAGCLLAFWWQVHQALAGNLLSWAYTIEWPIFAVIAVVGWWQLIHEDPSEVAARRGGTRSPRLPTPSPGLATNGLARPLDATELTAEPGLATPSPDAWHAAKATAAAAAYAAYLGGITDGRRPRGDTSAPQQGAAHEPDR